MVESKCRVARLKWSANMVSFFRFTRRFTNICLVLLLAAAVAGGWSATATASDICKSWVTTSNSCATGCASHGAVCDIYQCYNGYEYTSASSRDIWTTYPAWIVSEL